MELCHLHLWTFTPESNLTPIQPKGFYFILFYMYQIWWHEVLLFLDLLCKAIHMYMYISTYHMHPQTDSSAVDQTWCEQWQQHSPHRRKPHSVYSQSVSMYPSYEFRVAPWWTPARFLMQKWWRSVFFSFRTLGHFSLNNTLSNVTNKPGYTAMQPPSLYWTVQVAPPYDLR